MWPHPKAISRGLSKQMLHVPRLGPVPESAPVAAGDAGRGDAGGGDAGGGGTQPKRISVWQMSG